MKLLLLILITSFYSYSFFLITNNGAHFKGSKVKVSITSNSTCNNTGHTPEDIIDYAIKGAKNTWNKVGRANIEVKKGGTLSTSDSDFITGELCVSDSDTSCGAGTVPKVKEIIIACNQNAVNFPSSSVLAISGPNSISGKNIKGSVILLNDTPSSILSTFSQSEMEIIMAHEIGHALGIGHSKDSDALMYFKDFQNKNKLTKDDIRAITHLYPRSIDDLSCLGFIGNIKDKNNKNYWIDSLLALSLGFLSIILVIKLFHTLLARLSKPLKIL